MLEMIDYSKQLLPVQSVGGILSREGKKSDIALRSSRLGVQEERIYTYVHIYIEWKCSFFLVLVLRESGNKKYIVHIR